MPMTDPPEGLDPIALQHAANVEMRGFTNSGEQAEQLEREAQDQRHGYLPGGGTR